ncbi:MAG: alpha/beta fold hydrolase [Victivallales bacterium]|nr:alpha/beta fold hydrolase [Victivallales bacterium]
MPSKQESIDKQELVDLFMDVAESGELPSLLKNNATFNIDFFTMGGKKFWESHPCNGWNLQFNVISGWWRILDEHDMRVARGTKMEQLAALLNDRPTSIVSNYFDEGYRFSRTPSSVQSGRIVVLIHGWGVRASSMQNLADALAQNGYEAYNYDYPTRKKSIEEHCQIFLEKYRELLGDLPPNVKIHFLTHSMGGLVLRGAMANMTEAECRRISAIVMLGPPNRGSGLAYFGKVPGVNVVNKSLKDMAPTEDSFVSNIAAPPWLPPVGIIAGLHDGKVALENTRLPEPLQYKHTVVNCTHPGLRNPKNVLSQVLSFFSTQSF